jgi:phospholipase/carboxylesterase
MIQEKSTPQSINMHYDLYVPEQAGEKPMPLLIALHGYEGNKESMMALAQKINHNDFLIASVQGPHSFFIRSQEEPRKPRVGFGWMMLYKAAETIDLHHRTLLSVIETVAAEQQVKREEIFLLAFSQASALNYRFTFTHPNLIRGVVAVCGGIPGDWQEDKYHETATDVLIIAGEGDDIYPIERARTFKEALSRRARTVDFISYPTGHVFMREALPVINDWLLDRVQR